MPNKPATAANVEDVGQPKREASLAAPTGYAITIEEELCLLHSDINPKTGKGTAALTGFAKDTNGVAWELDACVTVKWKRVSHTDQAETRQRASQENQKLYE